MSVHTSVSFICSVHSYVHFMLSTLSTFYLSVLCSIQSLALSSPALFPFICLSTICSFHLPMSMPPICPFLHLSALSRSIRPGGTALPAARQLIGRGGGGRGKHGQGDDMLSLPELTERLMRAPARRPRLWPPVAPPPARRLHKCARPGRPHKCR